MFFGPFRPGYAETLPYGFKNMAEYEDYLEGMASGQGLLGLAEGIPNAGQFGNQKINIPSIEDNLYEDEGGYGPTGGSGYFSTMGRRPNPSEGY
tara:strand:- start:366 stop:647 length:282 start_codon:yes stop_codon:yes gene_type:complete